MALDTGARHENDRCFHGHPLQLAHNDIPAAAAAAAKSFTCKACKEQGIGPRYRCAKSSCDFILHEECYQPPLSIQHPHFPGHIFNFHIKPQTPNRFCDACGKPVLGFVYHCTEGGWDLHPCCCNNNLPREINFSDGFKLSLLEDTMQGTHHDLISNYKTKAACFRCKNATLKGTRKGVSGWSYVSACGADRCHVYCMMKWLREITARPRAGTGRANMSHESWWETLSYTFESATTTLTQFILGDPTGIMLEMLTE